MKKLIGIEIVLKLYFAYFALLSIGIKITL